MFDPAVEEAFFSLLDLEPDQQARGLRALDPAIRTRVEALLAADRTSEGFFTSALESAATAWTRQAEPEAETMLGAYRITGEIGRGGMGRVYMGVRADGQFDQRVAIKIVELPERFLSRFHQERRILAQLSHPQIARLLDGGATAQGLPYFVMELVEGALPIDVYCERKKLAPKEIVQLFLPVLQAVEYVHRSLVVHGDLKPNNILVDRNGVPKLVDFGIAKLLASDAPEAAQTAALTLSYASPEQVTGKAVTTATDVYGIAGVLYRTLTGEIPIALEGRSLLDTLRAICEERPVLANVRRPALGLDLSLILDRGLRKEPGERYSSIAALRADLVALLEGRPVEARGANWLYRAMKNARRRWVPIAALVAIFGSMAAAIVSIRQSAARAEEQREIAVRQRAAAESAKAIANEERDRAERMRTIAEAKTKEANEERAHAQKNLDSERGFANSITALIDNELFTAMPESAKIVDAWMKAQEGALAQDPSNPNARRLLGILHLRRAYFLARKSMRSAEADCKTAVSILEQVARAAPDNDWTQRNLISALGLLGQVYAATQRAAEGIEISKRAVALADRFRPEDPVRYKDLLATRSLLADLYLTAGRIDEGIQVQQEAYGIWSKRPKGAELEGPRAMTLPLTMQRYARSLRQKDPKQAELQMRRALELLARVAEGPRASYLEWNEYANSLNACEWESLRKPEIAMQYALKAVAASPKETKALALDTLAWSHFRKGDVAKAISTQKEAIGMLPPGFSLERMSLDGSLKTFQKAGTQP